METLRTTEMAITIPPKAGGSESIRSLHNISSEAMTAKPDATRPAREARLWLQVTRRGEEPAIYYYRDDAPEGVSFRFNEIPPLDGDVGRPSNERR